MGIATDLRGKSLYLDVNVFIYFLEDFAPLVDVVSAIFLELEAGRCTAVTSELTLAELLVKPLRDKRADVAERYKELISDRDGLRVSPVSRDVLIGAAELRANQSIKLPDAIHAATALCTRCDVLVTNDQRFKSIGALTTNLLSAMTL